MEKKTPLYDVYGKYGGKIISFGGYLLPVQFKGIMEEHMAVRTAVGLFDVSHMGEITCRGKDALAFLNRVLTNDYTSLKTGSARYSPMCNDKGGIVDDLIVYKVADEDYFIVVNAATKDKDHAWMQAHVHGDCRLADVSDQYIQLALQGPKAEDVLRRLLPDEAIPKKPYTAKFHVDLQGTDTVVSRTGYTGEDGFELYFAVPDAEKVWNLLLETGRPYGIQPCGLGARDTLRMEAAMPLYGQEMSAGKSTVTYNVTPEQDSVLFLQLNLGNATGANTVTISGVKVEEVSYASAKNAIAGFRFDSMGCLSKGSDDGYVTSLEKYNSSATFRIKKAPAERHAWNAKVIVDTGITPKAGLGYRVTFDVNAAKSQNLFELFCDGNEELAYGALYEQYLAAGNNTISYTIMPGDSKGPLTLQLRFGETNDTSGNTYTISNFTLEEVEFVTAYNPEIKDACVNDTQDGYTTVLKKAANKASVQLVNTPTTVEEGMEAWKNKLFVYTGVVFEPDQKYRVSFNVKSIVPAPFEVCYNKRDEEKGLGAIFGLTSLPEGKYVEYTTYAKEGAQLVIQLSLGNCTAPNTIFLSDVKVEKAGTINLASDTIYHF